MGGIQKILVPKLFPKFLLIYVRINSDTGISDNSGNFENFLKINFQTGNSNNYF